MDKKLQAKVDLMGENYLTVRKSAKMDWGQAVCLGALMFTQCDEQADEARIRECRKLLKSKTSYLSNLRGITSLALICKMSMEEDPETYLDELMEAYETLTANKKFPSETLVYAAEAMAEGVEKDRYAEIAKEAWETIAKMKFAHPYLTSQSDTAIATLLVMSGLDVDAILEEAEQIFKRMKNSGFKFNKDALQSISLILALSDKPIEEKCERFTALRKALKDARHKLGGSEMVVLAAFVDSDLPIETIAKEIGEADDALKAKKGFSNVLGCGASLRRLFASALVLQIHEKTQPSAVDATSQVNALSSIIVEEVITLIILLVAISSASAAAASASSPVH